MAFSSFSFDPTQIAANSTAASSALAGVTANSTAASSALAGVTANSTAASSALAGIGAVSTAASSALAQLTSAIFSDPTTNSFVVKNILYTSAGEIKYRYSTAAEA
jgi:hypothetical protein